ncbi:hypothetical protein QQS21_010925 [Conoideocrella luteorostrata]|uniref:Nephrocystin 3-like N-terminal domain-containing protein n=1 Tax=Conoideocrella luteorostrata TaxID=1105319 RepID=A0AAJ0CIJ2_9HYPO|nr:hypothetical protein QQS21_010925 [Conoideocrella luteorostrata]
MKSLDQHLRTFLQQWRAGHKTTSELISKESRRVIESVTTTSQRFEIAIRHHVTHEVRESALRLGRDIHDGLEVSKSDARRAAELKRLLRSLKFEGMNERVNDIKQPERKTFRWILADCADKKTNPSAGEHDDNTNYQSSGSWISDSEDGNGYGFSPEIVWDPFNEWLKSDGTTYWISGKPGSGKSTLVKYIYKHDLTQSSLRAWKESPVIILSHFFWRPGTCMQKSIRGLLSSLLYQLLEVDPNFLDVLLNNIDKISSKDSITDWSLHELRVALSIAMTMIDSPICVFVDGVDEMDGRDNTIHNLMELVDDWIHSRPGKLKICFSSRPEIPIRMRLITFPHLRLEDLTAGDMKSYIVSKLKFPSTTGIQNDVLPDDITSDLLQKAEGVFLWLYIVINDLNMGIQNGYDMDDLHRRVSRLHGDLAKLYEDMWSRLNDNEEIYRERAAFYLRLIIVALALNLNGVLVIEMLLAPTEKANQILTSEDEPTEFGDFSFSACQKLQQNVLVSCAGLVDIYDCDPNLLVTRWQDTLPNPLVRDTNAGRIWQPNLPYMHEKYYHILRTFRFIHRTALEFLTETEEGQRILSNDTNSEEQLRFRLLEARLAISRMFHVVTETGSEYFQRKLETYNGIHHVRDYLKMTMNPMGAAQIPLREKNIIQQGCEATTEQHNLLHYLESLHRLGKLIPQKLVLARQFHEPENWVMLVLGASLGCYSYVDFNVSRRQISKSLKSQLLLLCGTEGQTYVRLLQSGANPNMVSSGINWFKWKRYYILDTPFTCLLKHHLIPPRWIDDSWLKESFWTALQMFMQHAADMKSEFILFFLINMEMPNIKWASDPYEVGAQDEHNALLGTLVINAWDALKGSRRYMGQSSPKFEAHAMTLASERIVTLTRGQGKWKDSFFEPCKMVSSKDSEYILENLLLQPFRIKWSENYEEVAGEVYRRCEEVFDRSAPGEGCVADHLERLGFWTRKQYTGGDDVENPWKPST